MRKIHKLLPAIALALAASKASAQVLYEPFNYTSTGTTGSALDAVATDPETPQASPAAYKHYSINGTYWGRRGTTTGNTTISAGSNNPNGIGAAVLPTPMGNSARLTTSSAGRTPSLGFGEYINQAGDLYWSMSLRMNAIPTSTTGAFIAGFNSYSGPGDALTTYNAGLRVRQNPTDLTTWQVGLTEYSGTVVWDTTHNFAVTDTPFIVSKLTIGPTTVNAANGAGGTNDDTMYMWVNPQSGFGLAEGNAGIPAPTLQITALRDLNDSLTPPAAAHAGFFLRTATGTGPPFVDEIRADRTWAGVTPDGNLQQSWNQAGDGTWSTNTNWNDQVGGGVSAAAPNATGRVANFGTGIATGSTITVDADQTVDSLVFTNTGALTVSGNKLIVSSNASAGQIVAWAGNHTIGSALDMSGDSLAVKAAQGASLTLSGAITGTGKTLSKYGQGSVKLGASNLIADDVKLNVRSGPLDLNGNNETVDVVALGLGHPNPATAINNTPDLANGQIVGAGTLTANSYDLQSGTVSATLAGVNGVVKNNQATVTLSGTNAYTGNTVVNGGVLVLSGTNSNPVKAIVNAPFSPTNGGQSTLSVSADSNFGAVPASPVADSITVSGGARFRATADMVLNSNRGIVVNGTVASPTSPGLFDVSGGATLAYGGVVSGTAGVTKTGAGALLLSGANTYAGASNVVGGTAGSVLRIGADNSLPTGTTLGLNTLVPTGSATFDLGTPTSTGFNQTVAAVVNNSPLGAAAPTITNSGTAIRTFTINNATASTVAASMTGNLALAKSNAGTLTVTGANTYAGDTIARAGVISVANTGNLGSSTNGIVLAGGTLLNTGAIASSRNVSVDALGGTLETGADHTVGNITGAGALTKTSTGTLIANHVRTPSLTISAGTVKIASTGGVAAGTSVIDTYNLGANRLDITDNKLITTMLAGNADPETGVYSGVQGDIQRASNGGAWDAPGLTTSMPDAVTGLTSIGVATGEQIRGLGPTDTDLFAGQTINGASTIAMYTYAGDANLDGFISGDDYSTIDFNAGSSADGWVNGDFNYDGIVSGDDYSTIDFNYAAQGAPFPTSGSAGVSGVTAVPEPASLGLFGLAAAAGLLARRRRAK